LLVTAEEYTFVETILINYGLLYYISNNENNL